jgi:hypothetical protein
MRHLESFEFVFPKFDARSFKVKFDPTSSACRISSPQHDEDDGPPANIHGLHLYLPQVLVRPIALRFDSELWSVAKITERRDSETCPRNDQRGNSDPVIFQVRRERGEHGWSVPKWPSFSQCFRVFRALAKLRGAARARNYLANNTLKIFPVNPDERQ